MTNLANNSKTDNTFGERLRQGRRLRGVSLRELSEKMPERVRISHAALQKYEKGINKPNSTVLLSLSKALDLRPDYFVQQSPVALKRVEFRKRAKFGVQKQDMVIAQAQEYLERYLGVEALLGIPPLGLTTHKLSHGSPSAMGTAMEKIAERVREEWQLGKSPLSGVIELLEDRGVKVFEVQDITGFDGLSATAGDVPVVVLASDSNKDLVRKRFTALHELAHLVVQWPSNMETKVMENLCHRFAGAMLIPADKFREEFGGPRKFPGVDPNELLAIKSQWGISASAIMRRAKDLGLLNENSYTQFCIWTNVAGWRKSEPNTWKGAELSKNSNRFSQLVHRALAKELITRSKATSLLNLTLSELDKGLQQSNLHQ